MLSVLPPSFCAKPLSTQLACIVSYVNFRPHFQAPGAHMSSSPSSPLRHNSQCLQLKGEVGSWFPKLQSAFSDGPAGGRLLTSRSPGRRENKKALGVKCVLPMVHFFQACPTFQQPAELPKSPVGGCYPW